MPDFTAVFVVGTIFGFTAIIVVASMYLGHRARQMRHETIRLALEKGQPLPPEMLAPPRPDKTRGVRLIALGIGLGIFLYLIVPSNGTLHGHHHVWAVGIILVAVGIGHLLSHWLTRGERRAPGPGPGR